MVQAHDSAVSDNYVLCNCKYQGVINHWYYDLEWSIDQSLYYTLEGGCDREANITPVFCIIMCVVGYAYWWCPYGTRVIQVT